MIDYSTDCKIGRKIKQLKFHHFSPPEMNSIESLLHKILHLVEALHIYPLSNSEVSTDKARIYDNKSLMALLGIKDKYLKRLRDNGLLGYSRHGDKYWYTQSDIDRFLARCHYDPFNNKL